MVTSFNFAASRNQLRGCVIRIAIAIFCGNFGDYDEEGRARLSGLVVDLRIERDSWGRRRLWGGESRARNW